MAVIEGSIPAASWIHPLAAGASYWDSYEIPLTRTDLSAEELARALARQAPGWANMLMVLRDAAVRPLGLLTVGPLGQSARHPVRHASAKNSMRSP